MVPFSNRIVGEFYFTIYTLAFVQLNLWIIRRIRKPAAALFDEAVFQDDESARRKDETRNGPEM